MDRAGPSAAGFLFAAGWWFFIDGASIARLEDYGIVVDFAQYLPGIAATLAFFLVNSFSWEKISNADMYSGGECCGCSFKACMYARFYTAVLVGLAAITGGVVVVVQDYQPVLEKGEQGELNATCLGNYKNSSGFPFADTHASCSIWPGIAVMLQAILIFVAAALMRAALPQE